MSCRVACDVGGSPPRPVPLEGLMPRRHFWGWNPRRLAQKGTGCTALLWLLRGSLFPSSERLQICGGLRVSWEKPILTRAGVGGTEAFCFSWQGSPLT